MSQIRSIFIVLAMLVPIGCGHNNGGANVDPAITSALIIRHDKIPSFGDLKAVFKVQPSFGGLSSTGVRVENATTATWFANDKDLFEADFASSPVTDTDRPMRIIAMSPFQGEIEGFHIGDPPESWNQSAVLMKGMSCDSLIELGAGSQLKVGNLQFVTAPICESIPHMPSTFRKWGAYEVGVTGDRQIKGLVLNMFLWQIVNKDNKLYADRATAPATDAVQLKRIGEDTFSNSHLVLTDIPVELFGAPGLDFRFIPAAALPVIRAECSGLTDKLGRQTIRFYTDLADGLTELDRSGYWGGNPPVTTKQATEALRVYAKEYGAALRIMIESCQSHSYSGIQGAQPHIARAREARDNFVNLMKRMGLTMNDATSD